MHLEDSSQDIINKAQRGLKISDSELSIKANIDQSTLQTIKNGSINEDAIIKIAAILNLNPNALLISAKKTWFPNPQNINGLNRYISKFASMEVNSYLIWDPSSLLGIIADTGTDSSQLIQDIKNLNIQPQLLLLTHSHTDHIAALNSIQRAFPNLKTLIHINEIIPNAEPIQEGTEFQIGNLKISTRKTSGHSPGGLTYFIQGLEKPIAIVGDSLFAGSMGGAPSAYNEALQNNIQQILSLPNNTILCPGHGPLTTVSEEKVHNPFFA